MTENTTLQSIKRWLRKEDENSVLTREAFARLYEETHLIVFRYVYGLSGGPLQEAEDLTAETYARAWRTRHRFRGDGRAAVSWLLRIARNLAIDLSRRRKRWDMDEAVDVEFLISPDISPEMDVTTREQIAILWQRLHTVSADAREMLVLRYMLGWQVRQIASYLGRNENTVSVIIKRSLKNLQRDWSRSQEQEYE